MHFDEIAKGLSSNLQNLSYINQLITSDWPFPFGAPNSAQTLNQNTLMERQLLTEMY